MQRALTMQDADSRALANPQAFAARLHDLITQCSARVRVIGLGYVGLTVAHACASRGFPVRGFDLDAGRTLQLNAGTSPIDHLPGPALADMLARGFRAETSADSLLGADIILICVPTPLDAARQPDLGAVRQAMADAARSIAPGGLIVLESTVYPGATAELAVPALRAVGRTPGQDVFLAYSPERENPGDTVHRGATIPRVVGAEDSLTQGLVAAFYRAAGYPVVPVGSLAGAEAVKLIENAFRLVNIAFANEVQTVLSGMGIDVQEALAAAATKPFGFMPFQPGPGVGGHCIPVDPLYLSWQARRVGLATPLIDTADAINHAAPSVTVHRLATALGGIPLDRARVLVVGLAYKPGVEDMRESPAFPIIAELARRGATLAWHDAHVRYAPVFPDAPAPRRLLHLDALAGQFDAALIVTDHPGVDYAALAEALPLVADARGVYARLGIRRASVRPV